MMKYKILIVEDDKSLREMILKYLSHLDYECTGAASGQEGFLYLKKYFYDLIILDLNLGDMNGQEIVKRMRSQSNDLPVLIISTLNKIDMKLSLFNSGCDDYLTKPFYMDELVARTQCLIKRSRISPYFSKNSIVDETFIFSDISVNFTNSEVTKSGKKVELTKKLYNLLNYFIANREQIISRDQLMDRFWGESDAFCENTLTVHIFKLRQIIENDPSHPVYLKTKRGHGYIFSAQ